jgi:hypothetical protein
MGFMDLGGFDQCVFNHEGSRKVTVGISFEEKEGQPTSYKLSFSKDRGTIYHKWGDLVLEHEIPIPYGLNQTFSFSYSEANEEYTINWNGISCSVSPQNPTPSTQQRAREIAESIGEVSSSRITRAFLSLQPQRQRTK